MVNEVTDRVVELEEMGLRFKKQDDGKKFYQEKRFGSAMPKPPPMGAASFFSVPEKRSFEPRSRSSSVDHDYQAVEKR